MLWFLKKIPQDKIFPRSYMDFEQKYQKDPGMNRVKEFSYNILHMNNLFVRLNIRDWYFSRAPSSCWRRLVQSRRKCLKLVFLSRVATRFSKEDIFATINGCLFLTLKRNQFLSFQFQLYKLCKSLELWGFKFGLLIDHSALPSIRKLYIPGNFG